MNYHWGHIVRLRWNFFLLEVEMEPMALLVSKYCYWVIDIPSP